MNPEERQMITGLFDRMRQQGSVDKDRDAEALIRDTVRQMPDASYIMVQTVLVQEMALGNAQQQIEQLEDRVRSLEAQARPQQSSGGGSFLGGLFGGGAKPAPAAVPAGGVGAAAAPARPGGPWGSAPVAGAGGMPMQQGGMPMQQGGMMQQQPAGGGFMRSAMATAAGVAGGMLAANAISNMMNGGSSAQASQAKPASDASNDAGGSYAAAGNDSSNDAGGSYEAPQEEQGGYDDGGSWSSDE